MKIDMQKVRTEPEINSKVLVEKSIFYTAP